MFLLSIFLLPLVFAEVPRLPNHIKPTNYELKLITYLPGYEYIPPTDGKTNMTFEGEIKIGLEVTENTKVIRLHANKTVVIRNGYIMGNIRDGKYGYLYSIDKITESDEFQQIDIHFNGTITPGNASLILKFWSKFNNGTEGFYTSPYEDRNGNRKLAAVTQFEAYYARSAIPCFDEPSFKATWDVTIIHPKGTTALSNAPSRIEPWEGIDTEQLRNFTITVFEKTPKMSSYLLAFVISAYEYKTAVTNSGLQVRLHFPPDIDIIDDALDAAVKIFDYFEVLLGIKFPISKIDLIGFEEFAVSAMENWGLITFNIALYSSPPSKYTIATIAHEIAHQWFGNLVTMDWWSDLWLNEGFATFYTYLGTHNLTNGTNNYKKQTFDDVTSYLTDHLCVYESEKPTIKQIYNLQFLDRDAFADTTYEKGGIILNMFRNVIGHSKFDQSIRNYLKEQSYSSANSSIFFSYFQMPKGKGPKSVDEFLRPWLEQVGHPLITVNHFNETHNILSQSRFDNGKLAEIDKQNPYPNWGYQWDIPVWYQDEKKKLKIVWLLKNSNALIIKSARINPGGNGIFRIKYEVDPQVIDESNEYKESRLTDAFALLISKQITEQKYFKTIESLGNLNYENQQIVDAQKQILEIGDEKCIKQYRNIFSSRTMPFPKFASESRKI